MKSLTNEDLNKLWSQHNTEWRDPIQITSQWEDANKTNPQLLQYKIYGNWWEILEKCQLTLLVTREYEHLIMAITVTPKCPIISFMRMPHPSGLVVDQYENKVYVASTRNPNQVYKLLPVIDQIPRLDMNSQSSIGNPLIPVQSCFYPGCLYIHDLAIINHNLYANSVGQNAIVWLKDNGLYEVSWWPQCIDTETGPAFGKNYLQLNSIATGKDLASSYFSASTDKISFRRPGHANFPVDKRGVIFSGSTREPIAYGLTRPHSARLHAEKIWVDNSGYGELGFIENQSFTAITPLPGWTRGLCFYNDVAFVGTSRVIPRFRQYAPGVDADASQCGIHAVDTVTGSILGGIIWPHGNQIFAIDWIPRQKTLGFPFIVGTKRATQKEKQLFYTFKTV